MEYDVVIVGAGPSGLAAAIRLKQLNPDISVVVCEKGAEVGAHILSGNVFEPRALNELIPDWKEKGAPLDVPAGEDTMIFMFNDKSSMPLPFVPPSLHNDGNYIISLGELCQWLAAQAEELGVEIYPGFAASEVLYSEAGVVEGIATKDCGIGKDGVAKDSFARGMELRGKQTLFSEGCRGFLSEQVMKTFDLRKDCGIQTYGLGVKEVWEIDPKLHQEGKIVHTLGWPLQSLTESMNAWGGSFLYHAKNNQVYTGFVVGLDYENPHLSPYQEFQRWKHHPAIAPTFAGGTCISYGARTINEGGIQAIPKLSFPGGALLGCAAGFLNVPKVKGSHTAMKSGMVAAEAVIEALEKGEDEAKSYQPNMEKSWVYEELHEVRNIHPSFHKGFVPWLVTSAIDSFILKGKGPTLHNTMTDAERTKPAAECKKIDYPKPDGVLSFDILTNLARSGTNHEGDQPVHLTLKPGLENVPGDVSYPIYDGPEQRFCPAKVYEYAVADDGKASLVRNAQNCLHCKACDIKMPQEYVHWTVPEGGGGPAYSGM